MEIRPRLHFFIFYSRKFKNNIFKNNFNIRQQNHLRLIIKL